MSQRTAVRNAVRCAVFQSLPQRQRAGFALFTVKHDYPFEVTFLLIPCRAKLLSTARRVKKEIRAVVEFAQRAPDQEVCGQGSECFCHPFKASELLVGDPGNPPVSPARVIEEPLFLWRDIAGSKLRAKYMLLAGADLMQIAWDLQRRRRLMLER